jgi:hypothetical protein
MYTNLVAASHGEGGAVAVVGIGEEALANASVGSTAVLQVSATEEQAIRVRGGRVEVHACAKTRTRDGLRSRARPKC